MHTHIIWCIHIYIYIEVGFQSMGAPPNLQCFFFEFSINKNHPAIVVPTGSPKVIATSVFQYPHEPKVKHFCVVIMRKCPKKRWLFGNQLIMVNNG